MQRDSESGRIFPNIVLELVFVRADEGDQIDIRWVDDRGDPTLTAEALPHAPRAWRKWIDEGITAILLVRRRVLSSKIKGRADQMPKPGSEDDKALTQIYEFIDGRKHYFELLAVLVKSEVLKGSGSTCHAG